MKLFAVALPFFLSAAPLVSQAGISRCSINENLEADKSQAINYRFDIADGKIFSFIAKLSPSAIVSLMSSAIGSITVMVVLSPVTVVGQNPFSFTDGRANLEVSCSR